MCDYDDMDIYKGLFIIFGIVIVFGSLSLISGSRMRILDRLTPAQQRSTPQAPLNSIDITLNELNSSGESGTANLTEVNGKVIIAVNLNGEPKDEIQPMHIHEGTCPGVGKVIYPLNYPQNGASTTMLDTTFGNMKPIRPLSITVHSLKDLKVYVACGEIPLN